MSEKRNWQVTMRCTVKNSVYVKDCTEDEARSDPFNFSEDELEIDQEDYEVLRVEPAE